MPILKAAIVDVFADRPLSGNPLAVVENAEDLDVAVLRNIAREFNQAETTFLLPSARADWRLRSFTANGSEIYGAGHNALGAWLWLANDGRLGDLRSPRTFTQEIGEAVLPITLSDLGRIEGHMTQSPLTVGRAVDDVAGLAASLGLDSQELLSTPAARVADTGAPHLMVRAVDAAAVDRAEPDAKALFSELGRIDAEGCYLYAFNPSTPEAAYARFFNPTVGLWEDSATGTAAGPLCAYLGKQGLLAASSRLTIEQGVRMGRRSLLNVRLQPLPVLSGSGVVVLTGELRV